MLSASCVAVDWRTSSFRLWVVDEQGNILNTIIGPHGMSLLKPFEYENVLKEAHQNVGITTSLPVIISGMAGSAQGWCEAPYLSTPTQLDWLSEKAMRAESRYLQVHILPGVKQKKPADVIRSEETQIAGFLTVHPQFDGVVCLPGTHTKWVRLSDKEFVSFRTFMTGELFSLLSKQSVLKHCVADQGWSEPDFLEAVDDAISSPQQLSARLFGLRAEGLINDMPATVARARLSGYLIGLELSGAKAYWLGQDLVAIGAPELSQLYALALKSQGLSCRVVRGDDMTLEGIRSAHKALQEAR